MQKYIFDDLDCKAWFQERGEKSPFLVVEVGGKVIGKRLAGRIKKDEAGVRCAAEGVILAVEETKKIGQGVCPKCSTKFDDGRIKKGKYKVLCPACGWGIMI